MTNNQGQMKDGEIRSPRAICHFSLVIFHWSLVIGHWSWSFVTVNKTSPAPLTPLPSYSTNECDKNVFQRGLDFLKLHRPEAFFQQGLLQDFRGGLPWGQKQVEHGPRRLDAGDARAPGQHLARPSQVAGPRLAAHLRKPPLQGGRGVAADELAAVH